MRPTGKVVGKIYMWCYPDDSRDFPGWHLTADTAGCTMLANAIAAIAGTGTEATSRALPVLPATPSVLAVPNNRRAQARSATKIRFASAADDPRRFGIYERDGVVTVEVGRARLDELRSNVIGITRGEGDFAMVPHGKRTPPQQSLWFWWMLSQNDRPKRRR